MQRFLSICKLCKPTFYSNEKIYRLGKYTCCT
nr:MAG TPA: FLZ zinc-finger of the FCS-type, C2-C2 [Caudoviricetes sp.]